MDPQDGHEARLAQLDRALASGAKGNEGVSEQSAGVSVNVRDSAVEAALKHVTYSWSDTTDKAVIETLAAEVRRLRELGMDEVERHEATRAQLEAELTQQKLETQHVVKLCALLLGVDAEKTVQALQEWDEEMPKLRAKLAQHEKWAGDRNYCDSCGKSILNIVTANAKLARVEALPAKWRRELEELQDDPHYRSVLPPERCRAVIEQACAEVEAALRGEP